MKAKCEFELGNLLEALIGIRVDQKNKILSVLGIDLSDESFRSQFQGVRPPARENSALRPENVIPVALADLSSELHPESVSVRIEFHRTLASPCEAKPITQGTT